MVARVFAPSHLTIDAGDRETLRQRGAEQKMIDAQTGIASKGVPEILPERVDPLARVHQPCSTRRLYASHTSGRKQRVIDLSLRRIDVEIGRHDVVIAGEHHPLAGRERARCMLRQPVDPRR